MSEDQAPSVQSHGTRPSLFASKPQRAASGEKADSLRMLSRFGSGISDEPIAASDQARSRRRKVWWALGFIGLFALLGGIWRMQSTASDEVVLARAMKSATVASPSRTSSAPTEPVAATAANAMVPASAPALIETVAPPTENVSRSAPADAPAPAEPTPAAQAALPATAASAMPSERREVTKAQPTRSANSTTRRQTAPKAAPPADDADVDLLTALMSHLQGERAVAQASVAPRARSGPRTIAQLVQECQRLGSDKSLQCRREICEGSWGQADACPLNLAPAR